MLMMRRKLPNRVRVHLQTLVEGIVSKRKGSRYVSGRLAQDEESGKRGGAPES
jgi:hypothetical protein